MANDLFAGMQLNHGSSDSDTLRSDSKSESESESTSSYWGSEGSSAGSSLDSGHKKPGPAFAISVLSTENLMRFDKHNHKMEFMRTLIGLLTITLQVVILAKIFGYP